MRSLILGALAQLLPERMPACPGGSEFGIAVAGKDEADKREKVRLGYENHRRFTNVRETPGTVHGGAIVPVEDKNVSMEDVASALIIGTAQEVTDRLQDYAGVGIDDIQANFTFGAAHRDVMGSLERFAKDVMPHFA